MVFVKSKYQSSNWTEYPGLADGSNKTASDVKSRKVKVTSTETIDE